MSSFIYAPTVVPYDLFDAWSDAQVLRQAMKGLGTDEDAIIDLLAQRTNIQRIEIVTAYKSQFGRDLIDDLKDELKGNFEDAIVALMTPYMDFLAKQLRGAMSGAGTTEKTLIEIMYTVSPCEIGDLKKAYEKLFERDLEEDLKSETSGHFKKLLVSLSTGLRDFAADVDHGLAVEDANHLMEAGDNQWGTDESAFLSILATRNFLQLRDTFEEYYKLTSKTIEHSVDAEFSGDTQMGLLSIVKCARNMPAYFADRLYHSMKEEGLGTDDQTLIRIVVTRCEMDMKAIKVEFETAYGKPLQHYISGDTSGDYKKVLLALVRD